MLLCGAVALLFLWLSWTVTKKGIGVLRDARREMAGSATARGTCVGAGATGASYRFVTPDGETRVAHGARTGNLDTPKVGSTALLRYRKDDPKVAATFLTTVVAMPVGGLMTLVPAVVGVSGAAVIGSVAYAVTAGSL
ncbi:hypothetical protein SUDANB176_05787 [Streptomyces sp. enrichment culture]|uniref:hypothetical protein n=1 Tax=Streptomyces sp. enrichment culture TaxID=1795815 RepID=UPI003F55849B